MSISVVGLNHKTAPLALREKLAFDAAQTVAALRALKEQLPEAGFVLLSTCNRTELYCGAEPDTAAAVAAARTLLVERSGAMATALEPCLYVYHGVDAARHLLTVATSLDSLVIGEPQIVAQVKESYALASEAEATTKVLNRLFHCAFATSKEVYSTTAIAQGRVSVAGVAVELACQLFEDLTSAEVAVIGAGDMTQLLIRHLQDKRCGKITIFNRTAARAQALAEQCHVTWDHYENLAAALQRVHIVVSAAAGQDYLFGPDIVAGSRRRSLLIIDIAVPRNFDPATNDLNDVYLYSIDDLMAVAQQNIAVRREDIGQVERIIGDNVESFMDWFGVSEIGPLVGQLRRQCQTLCRDDLRQFLGAAPPLPADQTERLELAVTRIMNKLLHRVIHATYQVARDAGAEQANALIRSILEYEQRGEADGRGPDRRPSE